MDTVFSYERFVSSLLKIPAQLNVPSQRIYFPFLILSFFLIYLHHKKKEGDRFSLVQSIFKTLKNKSFYLDFFLLVVNAILKGTLFSGIIVMSSIIAWDLQSILGTLLKTFRWALSGSLMNIIIFTLLAYVFDDFIRFFVHRLMHRISFLWKFHKVHHSASLLTPFTLFRLHPVEVFISALRNSLSAGCVAGCSLFLFGQANAILTVMKVGVIGFIFNGLFANLRHSSVPMRFGIFENILISPYMHQIHHSRDKRHFNKNYGTALIIWDKVFDSALVPDDIEELSFGKE